MLPVHNTSTCKIVHSTHPVLVQGEVVMFPFWLWIPLQWETSVPLDEMTKQRLINSTISLNKSHLVLPIKTTVSYSYFASKMELLHHSMPHINQCLSNSHIVPPISTIMNYACCFRGKLTQVSPTRTCPRFKNISVKNDHQEKGIPQSYSLAVL